MLAVLHARAHLSKHRCSGLAEHQRTSYHVAHLAGNVARATEAAHRVTAVGLGRGAPPVWGGGGTGLGRGRRGAAAPRCRKVWDRDRARKVRERKMGACSCS